MLELANGTGKPSHLVPFHAGEQLLWHITKVHA
jgi:hypothetical protein